MTGLLFLLLTSLSALAQAPAAPPEEPKIAELDWMVGDWQAVDKSDSGGELLIHLSARRSDNQQALLYHVTLESKGRTTPKYDGVYYWNPAEKTYKLLQVSDEGIVSEGTLQQTGNRITQLVRGVTADRSFELKSDWEIRPREFHFVAQFRPEGKAEWTPAVDLTYSRVGIGALPPATSPSRHPH